MWKNLVLILEEVQQSNTREGFIANLELSLVLLDRKCKEYGIRLNCYQNIENAWELLQDHILQQFFWKEELLLITDNYEIAKNAQREKIAVLGYERKGKYLQGVSYIIQELEGISISYLEKVYARFHCLSVQIAETKRLRIREMSEKDAGVFYQMQKENSIAQIMEEKRGSIEEERAFIRNYYKTQYAFYDFGFWAIEDKKTKKLIGKIGIEQHSRENKNYFEFGYWIEKDKRRQGYAYEAGKAVLEFCKKELEISGEIYCFVQSKNIASLKTAQKLGFLKIKRISNKCYCCVKML